MLDVIVVGGGPAGLTAGMVLGRCRRKVLLCDNGNYRNIRSSGLHFFLTRDGISPKDFLEIARKELGKYQTVEFRRVSVTNVLCEDSRFRVELEGGETEYARKVLLATGVTDHLPEIDGVEEMYGTSIFHCPYCDGWEVRDRPIAIYGRGARGKGLSLELTAWSDDLVLCTDGDSELEEEDREALQRNHIRIVETRIQRLEGKGGKLKEIVFQNGEVLTRDALFFTLGYRQQSELPRTLGCDFTEKEVIRTGKNEQTDIPGLYIAGDASKAVHFAVVASAEGAQAAFAIHQELLREDLK